MWRGVHSAKDSPKGASLAAGMRSNEDLRQDETGGDQSSHLVSDRLGGNKKGINSDSSQIFIVVVRKWLNWNEHGGVAVALDTHGSRGELWVGLHRMMESHCRCELE